MSEIHIAVGLTGGGLALDAIRTATIADNDCAFVQMPGDICYVYRYESSSTASESSPDVIIPNDNSSGSGAWLKQEVQSKEATYGLGHWRYTEPTGIDGGTTAASGTVPLNEDVADEITSGSYPDSSYHVNLPAGNYKTWGYCVCYKTGEFRAALSNTSGIIIPGSTAVSWSAYYTSDISIFEGYFSLSSASDVWLSYWSANTSGMLGSSVSAGSAVEVYAELLVWSVE